MDRAQKNRACSRLAIFGALYLVGVEACGPLRRFGARPPRRKLKHTGRCLAPWQCILGLNWTVRKRKARLRRGPFWWALYLFGGAARGPSGHLGAAYTGTYSLQGENGSCAGRFSYWVSHACGLGVEALWRLIASYTAPPSFWGDGARRRRASPPPASQLAAANHLVRFTSASITND